MSDRVPIPFHVLFLCTGNSARSLIGEAVLRDMNDAVGGGRFRAFSAGSKPVGAPHPDALAELDFRGVSTDGLRSKSWDEFSGEDAERIDLVITVCDAAAEETCPVFHGTGVRAHWPLPDPAAVENDEARKRAFSDVFEIMRKRIDRLVRLPTASLEERQAIQPIANETKPNIHPNDYPDDIGLGLEPKPRR
ncbi:MAG: arsenate reductase ArsC [Litorimonas sp.]